MSRYRIIEETLRDNTKRYAIQERLFIWWLYWGWEPYGTTYDTYETYEEAHVELMKRVGKQVISQKVIKKV